MNAFSLGAPSWFWEAINALWLMICKVIYIFIGFLYRVFDQVARVNLFSTEVFKDITGRIYIVMGIAMLFIFAYNLVFMIINPDDKKGTGTMTKVVKETIISLIIIILLPTIFNWMYTFQNHILSSNIIGQLILGGVGGTGSSCASDDYECKCDFSKFTELNNYSGYHNGWIFKFETGTSDDEYKLLENACKYYRSEKLSDSTRGAYSVAPTVFSAFYRPANFNYSDCYDYLANDTSSVIKTEEDKQVCINFYYDVTMSKYTGDIKPFVSDTYLNALISDSSNTSMEFDWLWAIIAGGLAVWMFLCYAMEIGVRVAKLGLLQIISPITVMMRVVPGQKEKIYDKWFKNLKDTYLDVFIRLVIIYFSLFAISLVPDVINTMWSSLWTGTGSVGDFFIKTLATVIVILGILKFGQEAPELIKDFFGSGGKFALRSPGKQFNENKLAKGAVGALGAGASSMVGNALKGKGLGRVTSGIGGFFGGARRGFRQGLESKDLKGLKKGIMQAKYDSDEARDKHIATRVRGAINGHKIPVVSSIWGGAQNKWDDLKSGGKEFGRFISGEGAADFRAQAVADALGRVQGIKNTFKNAAIEAIENAQSKTSEEYNSGKKVNVNGVEYNRRSDGKWYGSDGSNGISHSDMGKVIKDAFNEMKKDAYSQRYKENPDAYAEMSKAMVTSLTDNMNKIGNNFSDKFFKEVSNGLNVNVSNMTEFSDQIDVLFEKGKTGDTDSFRQLYQINEGIEDLLKAQKLQNAAAAEAKKDK